MALVVITPPAEDPVSVEQAKDNSRVEVGDEDALIAGLITSGTQVAEAFTRRQLITATLELSLDSFPAIDKPIQLPKPPLQSVTSIKYIDRDGVEQTLTGFQVDTSCEPGRIAPAFGTSWPDTRDLLGAVKIRYVAGFGDPDAVPQGLRVAIQQMVSGWFENRESMETKTITRTPMSAEFLMSPHRARRFL